MVVDERKVNPEVAKTMKIVMIREKELSVSQNLEHRSCIMCEKPAV
jgi:hypothetical protein